jgi:hypothetical protein
MLNRVFKMTKCNCKRKQCCLNPIPLIWRDTICHFWLWDQHYLEAELCYGERKWPSYGYLCLSQHHAMDDITTALTAVTWHHDLLPNSKLSTHLKGHYLPRLRSALSEAALSWGKKMTKLCWSRHHAMDDVTTWHDLRLHSLIKC